MDKTSKEYRAGVDDGYERGFRRGYEVAQTVLVLAGFWTIIPAVILIGLLEEFFFILTRNGIDATHLVWLWAGLTMLGPVALSIASAISYHTRVHDKTLPRFHY